METYHALIAPHVVGQEGEAMPYTFLGNKEEMKFENSLSNSTSGLKNHVQTRHVAVNKALGR